MRGFGRIIVVFVATIFLLVFFFAVVTSSTTNKFKVCDKKFTSPPIPQGLTLEERCGFSYQRTQEGAICYEQVKASSNILYSYEMTLFFLSKINADYKGKDDFIGLHNKYCSNYPNLVVR